MTRRESEDALLVDVDHAIDHAGEMVKEAKADAMAEHEHEKTP